MFLRPDGKPFDLPGAAQMIFSDLGTINVEKTRGFSAYRWIRDELIRLGVPAGEIAYIQREWRQAMAKDSAYNPNLTLETEDLSLAWPPRVSPLV